MEDFEKIYSEYFDMVYGYCLRLSHDPSLAEEVTQESFFKALKAIDSFHGECRLSVWLCQIAKNTYFTLLKAPGRSGRGPADPPDPPHPAGTLPGGVLAAHLRGTELRPDRRAV